MIQLIADSGSTKTTWLLRDGVHPDVCLQTAGINPVRDTEDTICSVVASLPQTAVSDLYFYGAGCIQPYSETVSRVLRSAFPGANICVESDLLGAARALCGHDEGIACILGTGSNSCLYDGTRMVQNVSPLGWILGDEGSGAVLGRTLVGDLLKGQLPHSLLEAFLSRFHLTQASIIDAVYRQPQPNRFLAFLVPFLSEHRAEPGIHDLLLRQFRLFLARNVAAYQRRDLPVNCVGGVAYSFENELREAASLEGFDVGVVNRSPMDGMARFHEF